jgi:hypothetical protein
VRKLGVEGTTVEDFHAELMAYVAERKQKLQAGEKLEPHRLSESRQQLRNQMDAGLHSDLDKLLQQVSFMFYLRGYRDSASHQKTLKKVSRIRTGRARFVQEVRNMLERNLDMTEEDICKELDRLKVRFEIRSADGEGDKIGPGKEAWPWTAKPIPDAVVEAIRRIRWDVEHKTYARQRQLLLGLRD